MLRGFRECIFLEKGNTVLQNLENRKVLLKDQGWAWTLLGVALVSLESLDMIFEAVLIFYVFLCVFLGCLHFWGPLYFWGYLHFWGHHHFWGPLYFWGHLHFWGRPKFFIFFMFEAVFISLGRLLVIFWLIIIF